MQRCRHGWVLIGLWLSICAPAHAQAPVTAPPIPLAAPFNLRIG